MSSRALARSLAWALAYLAAGFLGRATVGEGGTLGLVWPAAGVGFLWLLLQDRSSRVFDITLLGGVAFAVNLATGAPWLQACLIGVANVVQTVLMVGLVSRLMPRLWGCGGRRTVDAVSTLAAFVFSASVACLAGVGIGTLGLTFLGNPQDLLSGVVWWGRNTAGILGVGILGHLVLHRRRFGPPERAGALQGMGGPRELLTLAAVTAGVYLLAFTAELPLAFPLLAVTVWAGLRFSTLVAATHSVLCGAVAIAFTLAGMGPFARVADAHTAALLAQLFLLLELVMALALATSADERDRLGSSLMAAQEQTASQAALLATLIDSMSEGIVVFNDRGEVASANDAAYQALGLAPGDAGALMRQDGRRWPDGSEIAPEDQPSRLALGGEKVRDMDLLFRGADEVNRILAVSATPLPPQQDGTRRGVLVLRDVTDDRRQREELGAFAGVVAHDLRNPLHVVESWAEVLQEQFEAASEGQAIDASSALGMLGRIRGASGRMRTLIEDLLTQATSQSRALAASRVDLEGLVGEVAAARGIDEVVRVGDLPEVYADRGMTRQLIDNLLGNAAKYVAQGVTPRILVTGEQRGVQVLVRVADNGIGIPEGHQQLVFQSFHRAHQDGYTGTGLGLAICARIVERHGGQIAVTSREGGGSVFELTLPAPR
ncbi:histidine kinase [Nocardioides gansuensis]|uniref:Sensor-like histidine kinase SenX3 n=1 Tax=Nocardioides gansuensis TaxID=2138300 RepID=A0A2T8F8M9_9ACTN|nr:ATP-binding protein [Nocardioides gansuensis]PVG82081.1 histidine kinase [Nocardioides gansuensis]